MSGALSFALFVLVDVIIYALVTGIAYKLRLITGSEARYRLKVTLFLCIPAVIFASILAYFHISLVFGYLGLLLILLIMVIGAIAYVVFLRRKMWSRRQPE